ncbi:MAG: hypothetical protein J0L82_01810 [Deltaproteobacteria bacterium]|jgi:hypothetical protein|nr:hypothetical protein [Deltaproteobacteria bacterium]
MPRQILAVFFSIAALISFSADAFANSAGDCIAASCWQNRYQGTDPNQAVADMNNTSLSNSQRYGACMASGDTRGCGGLQQAASADEGGQAGGAAGAAAGGAAAGGAVSAAPDSLEAMCPYTNTGSPAPPQGPEDAEAANCSATKSTTSTACLTPGTGGMNAGEAAMFTMMVNQMVGLAGQITSAGKNMAEQCRKQADLSKAMTAINGIKGAACGIMIGQCTKRCGASAAQFSAAAAQLRTQAAAATVGAAALETAAEKCQTAATKSKAAAGQCSGYSGQVMAMMMGAMQHGAGIVQNNQCAAEASAFANQPVPTFSPIALPNPTDCSDPNNQSLTCFCSRESNAKSPMCAGFNPGAVAGGGATTNGPGNGIGNSSATPFLGTGDDAGTDGNTVDPFASKQNASNGDSGFSPGGGGPPGGGALGSLGGDDGGAGGFGDPRSAITGTSGGQGGGLGSSGGGGGGGLARNNGSAGLGGLMDKFNLRKFLPGSKYKTRGIAGMSVKSVDGITGPMGPSIWEKATRQYQEQIQKQNVILDK